MLFERQELSISERNLTFSFYSEPTFIRRRSINRRHRNIQQTQINSKLRTMMNQVVHHESSHHCDAREGEDRFARHQQRPLASPILVSCRLKRSAPRRNVLVESFEQLGS